MLFLLYIYICTCIMCSSTLKSYLNIAPRRVYYYIQRKLSCTYCTMYINLHTMKSYKQSKSSQHIQNLLYRKRKNERPYFFFYAMRSSAFILFDEIIFFGNNVSYLYAVCIYIIP